MIPAGYLLKRVVPPPGWLSAAPITDVCSVSDCVNDNVVEVQNTWRHNGFGLANSPTWLWSQAALGEAVPGEVTLFYYEAYEQEIESDGWTFDAAEWRPLSQAPSAGVVTEVSPPVPPLRAKLIGYDVVVFEEFLEHSPLSCNQIADAVQVNEHCLFESLEAAKSAVDGGAFGGGCEPGVYRIFSVSVVTSTAGLGLSPP
jgi:hypothetical protein